MLASDGIAFAVNLCLMLRHLWMLVSHAGVTEVGRGES